jgi:hypothetical protein
MTEGTRGLYPRGYVLRLFQNAVLGLFQHLFVVQRRRREVQDAPRIDFAHNSWRNPSACEQHMLD